MSILLRYTSKFGTVACCVNNGRRCFTDFARQNCNRWAIIRRRLASEVKTVSKTETIPRTGYSGKNKAFTKYN